MPRCRDTNRHTHMSMYKYIYTCVSVQRRKQRHTYAPMPMCRDTDKHRHVYVQRCKQTYTLALVPTYKDRNRHTHTYLEKETQTNADMCLCAETKIQVYTSIHSCDLSHVRKMSGPSSQMSPFTLIQTKNSYYQAFYSKIQFVSLTPFLCTLKFSFAPTFYFNLFSISSVLRSYL